MSDLIERLEAATGPDRELDIAIAFAIGEVRDRDENYLYATGNAADMVVEPQPYDDHLVAQPLRYYTRSIDAALTLMPEGGRLRELGQWSDNGRPGGWFARVLRWSRETDGWCELEYSFGIPDPDANAVPPLAPNAAIALCIAALKARAALAPEEKK